MRTHLPRFAAVLISLVVSLAAGEEARKPPALKERVRASVAGLKKVLAKLEPDSEQRTALQAALKELEAELQHPAKQVKEQRDEIQKHLDDEAAEVNQLADEAEKSGETPEN